MANPAPLPGDLAACHAMIRQLLAQLGHSHRQINQMEHQLQQLLRRLYGRSAETLDPKQMVLFAELLEELKKQSPPPEPQAKPAAAVDANRSGHGRRKLPTDLPREQIVHDLPEDEKPCPCCGTLRQVIGREVSEQIDYEPATLKVIEHVRLTYGCRACEQAAAEGGPQIATAEKPLSPIEKGLAAPGLLAQVIVGKYGDSLPLHRMEKILERHGIEIARSTMADWMRQSADALQPLYDVMVREVLASKVVHTDDTPVDVLDHQQPGTRTGRFWVYLGDANHPQTVFTYTPSRSRDGPMGFLKDWGKDHPRFLQADAFGGYDGIYAGRAGGTVTEVACWAHARRKFYEAQTSDRHHSVQALAQIRLLYDVEDQAKGTSSAERAALRQTQAVPRLGELKACLESIQAARGGPVLPKSPMGQAITYALNQWSALCVYTTDGDLAIDNNAAENALRRVALGRKNWLFCGSDRGGHTAAVLFSFLATCQRHQVNPFTYLRDVLTRIAAHPHHQMPELLPHRWTPSV